METITSKSASDQISVELSSRRTGMSFQRTRMSADRTLMSVIRTSLSLISFGFTIFQVFREASGRRHAGARRSARAISASRWSRSASPCWSLGIIYHVQFMCRSAPRARRDGRGGPRSTAQSKFPPSMTLITAIPAADRHRGDRQHGFPDRTVFLAGADRTRLSGEDETNEEGQEHGKNTERQASRTSSSSGATISASRT